jgi:hypothetical protein
MTPPKSSGVSARTSSGLGNSESRVAAGIITSTYLAGHGHTPLSLAGQIVFFAFPHRASICVHVPFKRQPPWRRRFGSDPAA